MKIIEHKFLKPIHKLYIKAYRVPFIKRHFSGEALGFSKCFSLIFTPIIIILFVLSLFFENSLLSTLIQISMGLTIIHMGYVFSLLITIEDIFISEKDRIRSTITNYNSRHSQLKKYNYIQAFVSIILLFTLSYFPYKYSKQYVLKCETFYLDTYTGIYHIYDDCECITSLDGIERCKGSTFINKEYQMCELCVETQEDLEGYASDHYHHPD